MKRFLSRYTALCVLSLFLGIQYDVGLILRPFDAVVAVGGMILVGRASVRGYVDTLKKPTVYYLFATLYLYRGVNALFLTGTGTAVKETIQVIEFLLLAHLIAISTQTTENRRLFFRTLLIGSGIMTVLTAAWHVGNGYYVRYKELAELKYTFSLFALLASGEYLRSGSGRFVEGTLLVAVVLTLLSGERKGWVAFVGGVGPMYFLFRGGSIRQILSMLFRPRVLLRGGVLVTGVIAIGLQFEYVVRQLRNMGDVFVLLSNLSMEMDLSSLETSGSNIVRIALLLFTIRKVSENPLLGIGTDRFETVARSEMKYPGGAHSEYQRIAAENGLPGLFLYVLSWIVALRQAIRFYRKSSYGIRVDMVTIVGVVFYGAFINLFLGGGALNIVYLALSVGLLMGVENDETIF